MNFFDDFELLTTPAGEVLTEAKKRPHADAWMQHCVADVMSGGRNKSSAYAICTSQGQKTGYYEKGSRTPTEKGETAARSKAAKKGHKDVKAKYKALTRPEEARESDAAPVTEMKKVKDGTNSGHGYYKVKCPESGKMINIRNKKDADAFRKRKRRKVALKGKGQVNEAAPAVKGEAHKRIKEFYMGKGMKEEEASQIADKTLAKRRRGLGESRDSFMPWVEMHSEQNHMLDGARRVFTLGAHQGSAFLREATRVGGILEHYPGRNLVRVRFGDGDMMMRRNKKGYAVVVPSLSGTRIHESAWRKAQRSLRATKAMERFNKAQKKAGKGPKGTQEDPRRAAALKRGKKKG
jgi:hypothetical protein